MQTVFNISAGKKSGLAQLVDGLTRHVQQHGQPGSKDSAGKLLAMESLGETAQAELTSSVKGLNTAMEGIALEMAENLGYKKDDSNSLKFSTAQKMAGIIAGTLAGNIDAYRSSPVSRQAPAMEGMQFVPAIGGDSVEKRLALEAYDEKDNRNAVVYSIAYNMQASRQDEFGEAFFPTITVTPDQFGYSISVRLIQVFDEVRRKVTGEVSKNFGRRNIIQALIDPTILRNDQTKVIPVYRDESKPNFVADTLLTPKTVVHEGVSITTSALKIGAKFSLLGLSQHSALLETGLQDHTDALDPMIQLEKLYLTVQNADATVKEVIPFGQVAQMASAGFTHAIQGNYRVMNLNFSTDALNVNKTVKKADGAASVLLAPLVTGEYSVRLSVAVSGSVNLELADTTLFANQVTVYEVKDKDGNILDMTAGNGKTIADLFIAAAVIGYDLEARRTNTNRRERGQLLDLTYFNMVYGVPLLSPITVTRPLTVGDGNDSGDLAALITATHIRTSNAAVAKLLETVSILEEAVARNGGVVAGDSEVLGVGRFLVTPFFKRVPLDVADNLQTLKAHERAADIQATLVNTLRDLAYRMYRDSGYKAAADALSGGIAPVPTVIIGTDPVIARYLTVTGDFRTLGNEFNVKIVSTLNQDMIGKIVMTLGEFGEGKDGMPNPLHFGNMAWKPELTLVLPLHRNGANSKELTVQPSFRHVVNCPILAIIDVTGIEDSLGKISIDFNQV